MHHKRKRQTSQRICFCKFHKMPGVRKTTSAQTPQELRAREDEQQQIADYYDDTPLQCTGCAFCDPCHPGYGDERRSA